MWRYFWTYSTDLPPGTELPPFGAGHLGWVFVSLAVILATTLVYRKQTLVWRRKMEVAIAILMASGYVLRWGWAAVIGHYYAAEMLPLHLCSLAALVEMAAVFTRKPLLKEFGYACGIPGAVVAMVMPGIGPYPLWHFYYLLFILDHTILFLLPVLWITGDGFRPSFHRLKQCFFLLLGMAAVNIAVNAWLNSNFMFLHFVPEGVVLKPLSEKLGIPGYQFAMAGLLFLVWTVMYLPWMISAKKHRKQSR